MPGAPTASKGTTMLKTLWKGWQAVARKIGRVQSVLILTLVYFVAIAPFALVVRFFSDPLALRTVFPWQWSAPDAASTPDLQSVRQQF